MKTFDRIVRAFRDAVQLSLSLDSYSTDTTRTGTHTKKLSGQRVAGQRHQTLLYNSLALVKGSLPSLACL